MNGREEGLDFKIPNSNKKERNIVTSFLGITYKTVKYLMKISALAPIVV